MKCSNLNKIRKWYLFYSSQIDFLYQAGTKLQKVDNVTTPNARLAESVYKVGRQIKQCNRHVTTM